MLTAKKMTEMGIVAVKKFCKLNSYAEPLMIPSLPSEYREFTGLYYARTIFVETANCARLGYGGPAWSWPGYIIDRTPYGVYCHELGHFVDDILSPRKGKHFSTSVYLLSGQEEKLTGYAPNLEEWFAEMFRLFVTNPDLLRLVRPKTYEVLISKGLVSPETRSWSEVLKDAPERTKKMAARKITKV